MIRPILLTKVSALKKYTKGVPGDAVIVIVAAVYGATHYFYGTDLPDEVFASIVVAVVGVVRLFKRKPKEKKSAGVKIGKAKGEVQRGRTVVMNPDGTVSAVKPGDTRPIVGEVRGIPVVDAKYNPGDAFVVLDKDEKDG